MVKIKSQKNYFFLNFINDPEIIKKFSIEDWTLLVRMARKSTMLAHIGWVIQQNALETWVPEKVTDHIKSAQTIIEYRKRTALWELNRIWRALLECNIEIIILKGGAYLLHEFPFSYSRMFSDIDILVKKADITKLEAILLNQNWRSVKIDEYDQHYYREWMHEIPPLRHVARVIEVDIHHAILPQTSRLQPSSQKLIDGAIESSKYRFKVLSPCDMYLHSATHLFYDSDLNNKLKDLVDLDQLARLFHNDNKEFFNQLLERGIELNLQRPLFYALRYSYQLLETPLTNDILQRSKKGSPNVLTLMLMDSLVPKAILPENPDDLKFLIALSRWLLYVRSHYLRMPLKLLIPHLMHKSKVRWEISKEPV